MAGLWAHGWANPSGLNWGPWPGHPEMGLGLSGSGRALARWAGPRAFWRPLGVNLRDLYIGKWKVDLNDIILHYCNMGSSLVALFGIG